MKIREIILLISTSVLLALAFPTASLWPLAYIGLVPLLLWSRNQGYRRAFLGGTLSGLVFYGITFAWFATLTYWVGVVALLGVGLLVLLFALFWGAVVAVKCFFDRRKPALVPIAFAAVWVLMEYVQNHIFTGFGWGSLGYTQWHNLYVAQMASIGSVYIVTFYVVLINTLIYELLRNIKLKERAIPAAAAVVVLGALVPLWGKMRMHEPGMSSSLRVGVIQPNFSLDVKWNRDYSEHMLEVQKRLTGMVASEGAELVVWPESALYGYLIEKMDEIARIVNPNNIYLLVGSNHYVRTGYRLEDEIHYYNSAFLVGPKGTILGRYDKMHLAPFGEYVPMVKFLGFVGKVVPAISDFSPGKKRTSFEIDGKKFSVLICFENSFPHIVRKAAKDSDFLVQITNDGWFGRSAQPKQDLAIAAFRAIENGVTLIRGTNTGISCFVDPWGRISGIVRSSWGDTVFVRGTAVETISTVPHYTFYKAHGDVWVLVCGVIAAAAVGLVLYQGRGGLGAQDVPRRAVEKKKPEPVQSKT